MAKAPPQFNFYFNDWRGGTAHLTPVERSAYLDLLIYQWQVGHIPLQECDRMVLVQCADVGQWRHIWNKLRDKFEPFDLDETTVAFRNERMNEDREEAISIWKQRVSASKKGVRARRKKQSTERLTKRSTKRCTASDKDKDKDTVLNTKKRNAQNHTPSNHGLDRLPESLQPHARRWLKYKTERGERYKATGLQSFITHVLNRVEEIGEAEVIIRLDRAMASNWAGWDHERSAAHSTPQTLQEPF